MTTTGTNPGDLDAALAAIRERYRSADVRASLMTLTGSANDIPFLLALVESIRERRCRAEAALGRVRALAEGWIALAEEEDWADNPPTIAAGRAILAALGERSDDPPAP